MPDTTRILESQALAALLAVAMSLLGCRWRAGQTIGGTLGAFLGFCAGCWWLELWPRWPPAEDQGRLIYILLPAVVCVELLALLPERFHWVLWLLRLTVAFGAARVLLHDSTYLKETEGLDT